MNVSAGKPLVGMHVLVSAINLPGPAVGARLRDLGATVVKVEPQSGDPFERMSPGWYRELVEGIEVRRLDLKEQSARASLDVLLAAADLLVTSSRPASLARLGLDNASLSARFPRLCHVAIVGHSGEMAAVSGHDLTYQAHAGLIASSHMPRSLFADLAGVEQAENAALRLLLARELGGSGLYEEVALADAVNAFSKPVIHRLTTPEGMLGGGDPFYCLHQTSDGVVAVAALEPQFKQRLAEALGLRNFDAVVWNRHFVDDWKSDSEMSLDLMEYRSHIRAELERAFARKSAAEWERWALEHDLPIAAVRS